MGTTLVESSGSTGKPYNWARSEEERKHVPRMIAFFTRYTFDDEPLVVLNTFSMGAWATGLTIAIASRPAASSRPPGRTWTRCWTPWSNWARAIGPGGRLPAVPEVLLDEGERRGMDSATYEMQALLGGEGNRRRCATTWGATSARSTPAMA